MIWQLALILALFLVAPLVRRHRRMRRWAGKDWTGLPLISDPGELARAEHEARLVSRGSFTVLAVLRSDHGYTDSVLASLLIYLGSEGVDATYHATSVGLDGGAVHQFVVKVHPGQLDKAQALLRSKLG